jgi:hypothetical protein
MDPLQITTRAEAQSYLAELREEYTLFVRRYASLSSFDVEGVIRADALGLRIRTFVHVPWCRQEFADACVSGDISHLKDALSQQAVGLGLELSTFLQERLPSTVRREL